VAGTAEQVPHVRKDLTTLLPALRFGFVLELPLPGHPSQARQCLHHDGRTQEPDKSIDALQENEETVLGLSAQGLLLGSGSTSLGPPKSPQEKVSRKSTKVDYLHRLLSLIKTVAQKIYISVIPKVQHSFKC
jgi:hypothetical protein